MIRLTNGVSKMHCKNHRVSPHFQEKKKREKNRTILSKQTIPSLNAVQGTALKRAALAHQAEVQQVSNYTLNMFWMWNEAWDPLQRTKEKGLQSPIRRGMQLTRKEGMTKVEALKSDEVERMIQCKLFCFFIFSHISPECLLAYVKCSNTNKNALIFLQNKHLF